MGVQLDISIRGLEDALIKLNKVGTVADHLQKPMQQSVDLIYDMATRQPRKRRGAFSALATQAQKRAYWAKVRSGEAQHGRGGYIRSNRLRDSWQKQINPLWRGIEGKVWTDLDYARYVQGRANQQLFHFASGWKDEDMIAAKTRNKINRIFRDFIRYYLNT